jgi:lipid A 3-O-deacylase
MNEHSFSHLKPFINPQQQMNLLPLRKESWFAAGIKYMRVIFLVVLMSFAGPLTTANPAGNTDPMTLLPSSAEKRQWSSSLCWENDIFGDTDRFYTNGLSLALSHTGPSWLDPLVDLLPWGQVRRSLGYDLTQAMITPSDTTRTQPDPADRPYAGILSFGLTLNLERSNSYHGFKFVTGIVGPGALAGETQRGFHRLIGNRQPQGWDYQLKNEPILNLAYGYGQRFRIAGQPNEWAIETIPGAVGWLGNVLTQGQIGILLRAGYNIPKDFGQTLIRGLGQLPPPRWETNQSNTDWGFSIFTGGVVNLVLRDITLDGNTFTDSPRVDKNLLVPAAGMGITIGNRNFQFSFIYVFWAREFKGQEGDTKFGSVKLSYFF